MTQVKLPLCSPQSPPVLDEPPYRQVPTDVGSWVVILQVYIRVIRGRVSGPGVMPRPIGIIKWTSNDKAEILCKYWYSLLLFFGSCDSEI